MKSNYFCAYHAACLKADESYAYRHWAELMRRGTFAYTCCRMEAAELYLGAALDIALLRQECRYNELFGGMHSLKPAEFLLEIMVSDERFAHAESTLRKVSSITNGRDGSDMDDVRAFLGEAYQRLEALDKSRVLTGSSAVSRGAVVSAQIH